MQATLKCEATFACEVPLVLCTLHMLNRGAPPFLRLRANAEVDGATDAFDQFFESASVSQRRAQLPISLLRDGDRATEVVCVPIKDERHVQLSNGVWRKQAGFCFWCYRVVPGSMMAAIEWMHTQRMPLVLDLDDTLVVANGESALRDKRDKVCACLLLPNTKRLLASRCCCCCSTTCAALSTAVLYCTTTSVALRCKCIVTTPMYRLFLAAASIHEAAFGTPGLTAVRQCRP